MSRNVGIVERSAAEMLQNDRHPTFGPGVQPLPNGQPGRAKPSDVGIEDKASLTFAVVGDSGGINDPSRQAAVARALAGEKIDFVYHVGDVVYFNGDAAQYGPQFYEPYAHVVAPFVGIPGNHDGDTTDDPSRQPLDTFMANFCAHAAALPSGLEEYGRDVQTQPWCDWTLELQGATIVGLYSNVPSGGHLYPSQVQWLQSEVAAASRAIPLVVALHHPPYSVDAHHGGSKAMGSALDAAFSAARRFPELVLSGHVHDYQRFTRTSAGVGTSYVVLGNSGYHNLHRLAPGAQAGTELAPGVTFEDGDDSSFGYLLVTTTQAGLGCSYRRLDSLGDPQQWDSWTLSNAQQAQAA